MATVTIKKQRTGTDVSMSLTLTDGGSRVSWKSLSDVYVHMYADDQRVMAGLVDHHISPDDEFVLLATYGVNEPQYLGVNRVVISCVYRGRTRTYDAPVVEFVQNLAEESTREVEVISVDLTVEDVSTSLLEEAIAACIRATKEAQDVTDGATAAETTRAMAEAGRASAEMSRNAAETARKTAETARVAAETERAKKWPDVLMKHNLGIVRTHEEAVALMDSITESGVFFILNDDELVSYEIHSFVNEEYPDHRIQLYTMSDDGGSLYLRYYEGDGAWGEKAFADTDDLDDYMRLSGNQSIFGRKTFEGDVEMHYLELETGNFDLDNIYEHDSGDSLKELFDAKQDSIADLETIRTGAGKGATALQPSDVKAVAKTGSYNDLTDKPNLPDVSGKADKSYVDAELAKKNAKIKAGENVTITDNADGTQTISAQGGGGGGSTPVVDSLDSDSATSALSARQGKVLKGLVDGKQAFLPVTYAELKALRDAGGLTAGMQYRITDYECTTIQEDTRSAGHRFDIIVTADSESVLNENARAIQHEGDTYFADCNLAAWELKYSLDNDVERFAWSDENGKGVIYWMKDEWNNECPYDFKNIMFLHKLTDGEYDPDGGDDTWVYTFNGWDRDGAYCYDATATPHNISAQTKQDAFDDGDGASDGDTCFNNKITPNFENDDFGYQHRRQILNNIVFLGVFYDDGYDDGWAIFSCYSNTFGESCHSNTFGSSCHSNTFGNNCYSNTFGKNCHSNTFGENCHSNTFGDGCYSNTFGNGCYSNTFGSDTSSKINYCRNISLGDGVSNNKISGTTTPTSSKYLQNIRIAQGVTRQTILVATNLAYETYVGFGSNGALVMKNNLDQYTKPSTGIPSTDLAQSVRDTLAKVEEIYQDYIDANNLI